MDIQEIYQDEALVEDVRTKLLYRIKTFLSLLTSTREAIAQRR